jgi:formiminoglutamase
MSGVWHSPFHADAWQGRTDVDPAGYTGRWHQVVTPVPADGMVGGATLVGFACDAGVRRNHGRPGAAQGPMALRKALSNVALPVPYSLFDAGDVICADDSLEEAQARYAAIVRDLLDRRSFPVGLGGGHEIAWGTWTGLADHLASRSDTPRIGVLNLDAHLDLRDGPVATSGTPFRQIAEDCARRGWPFHYACFGASRFANTAALFGRAEWLDATVLLDEDMGVLDRESVIEKLFLFLDEVDHVYLTFCLDVLPPDLAPGVSAPSARGVALEITESIVLNTAVSGKLRAADVAELNPTFDSDQRTARVASRIVAGLVTRRLGTRR